MGPSEEMSHRREQVASLLKRAIATVLSRRLADPRIEGMISVTEVSVSPDMRNATVSVSILPQSHEAKTIAGLRHATTYIYTLVRDEVALKTVPHLTFKLDDSLKKQSKVFSAIQRGVNREIPNAAPPTSAEPDAGAANNPTHPAPEGSQP